MLFKKKEKVYLHISTTKIAFLGGLNRSWIEFGAYKEFHEFIQVNNLKRASTTVFIGGPDLFSQIVVIPKVKAWEVEKIIYWELYKFLGSKWAEDLVFDFRPLSMDKLPKDWQAYLVMGLPKNIFDLLTHPFAKVDLDIQKICPEAWLVQDLYKQLSRPESKMDCLMFLDEARFTLNFFSTGELIHSRSQGYQDGWNIIQDEYLLALDYLRKYFPALSFSRLFVLGFMGNNFRLKKLAKDNDLEIEFLDLTKIMANYFSY